MCRHRVPETKMQHLSSDRTPGTLPTNVLFLYTSLLRVTIKPVVHLKIDAMS